MHFRRLIKVFLIFLATLAPSPAQPQSRSYALVIGIDTYASASHPKLKYAAADARAVGDYLRSQGFEIISLSNQQATKQAIIEVMQNNLAPQLRRPDRVLVFFAGHGYTETLNGQEKGYIIPYDAGETSASFISMAELQEQSSNMGAAHHELFLMDSCFGGSLATRGISLSPDIPNYIAQVSARIAREVLTAGGKDQEVLDAGPDGHSPFVSALLDGLANGLADLDGNGYITFNELATYVTSAGSTKYSTPAAATLPGHQGGEFLFSTNRVASVGRNSPARIPAAPANKVSALTPPSPTAGVGTVPSATAAANNIPVGTRSPESPAPTTLPSRLIGGATKENAKDGQTYVWIPPGAFTMGCSPGDRECAAPEKTTHKVTLTRGFWIGQTEVTQKAYQRVINANPSLFRGDNIPVNSVDWNQAQGYCATIDLRLPTEAEWEYAARGPGSPAARYGQIDAIAWYKKNSGLKPHPVAGKSPNGYGLFDMLGNLFEWVSDWAAVDYPNNPETDPKGPESGSFRILRGGAWITDPKEARSSYRFSLSPKIRYDSVGFRCAGESIP